MHKTVDSRNYRYLWGAVFMLSVINLFYIAPGRTGMLVFLFLMVLFLIQRLTLLQQLFGAIFLSLMITLTFATSENFSTRTQTAIKEIQDYEYGASRSSLGMRFDWWVKSVSLIKEKPLFGHGTGAFQRNMINA